MQNVLSFILQAATVALIAVAIRWLFGAKGTNLPTTRGDANIYAIKWQFRAVGLAAGIFSVVVSIWSWHDLHHPDGVLIAMSAVFVPMGLWLANGSVSTNQTGITKKVLWSSRSFLWGDITEIRLHNKQGGAIELRADSLKLVIDSRFVAYQHLLNEIKDHTKLHPCTN